MTIDTDVVAPPGLPVDEANGIFTVLVVPWDEAASDDHDTEPGRVYRQGDVYQPRNPAQCVVNFDHGPDQAGAVLATATDAAGLWASVKLGRVARALVDRGRTSVSAEVADGGALTGIALATGPLSTGAFRSARIFVDGAVLPSVPPDPHDSALRDLAREADVHGGRRLLNPQPVPRPYPLGGPAPVVNVAEEKAALRAASISAIVDDVEHDRQRFEERMAALRVDELAEEERLLRMAMVPVQFWPERQPSRQQWNEVLRQQEAAREADRRRVEAAAIRECIQSWSAREAAPAQPVRGGVPWWRRLFRSAPAAG